MEKKNFRLDVIEFGLNEAKYIQLQFNYSKA